MVKIKTQRGGLFDNGALDMAMNLLYIQEGGWSDCPKEAMYLDFREEKHKDDNWRNPIIGFENEEEFVERDYETGEVEGPAHDLGMFPIEKLTKWDEDGFIEYPLINIKSIKFYTDTYYCRWKDENRNCLTIEIESDNDEVVREIFTMLAGLANGGHCCGGLIRINKQQMQDGRWVARFGLDGDGSDRIYYVDDKEMPC